MEDFIFGTFSTNESRIAHVLKLHGGVTHAQVRIPRDPQPGQAVQIHLSLGPSHPQEKAWVYWTNDGSDPAGENGVATNGFVSALHPVASEWDILGWGYVRHFWGEIPGAGDWDRGPLSSRSRREWRRSPCRRWHLLRLLRG